MAETWLKTYRNNGSFTFSSSGGTYRFHVIGKGGNGRKGSGGSSPNGGAGGESGGYAIHEISMAEGETAAITIANDKTTLTYKNQTVVATAGMGTASGGNVSNLPGIPGSSGSNGVYGRWGGRGGDGAQSIGKYQANGGSGGNGGDSNGSVGLRGVSPANTDTAIGGAGGGGGGSLGFGDTGGAGGVGATGGVVIELINRAPLAPPWIDIADKLLGGTETEIQWGAASDIDGNLAGYAVERSIDGSEWELIYKGSLRTFTDSVAANWKTVQYRVQAYDAEGSGSGYISTAKMTVIHNSPPQAPSSIFVPDPIFGGTTVTVSWSRAADTDDNLAGYTLEQNTGDGVWTEVKNTTALSEEIPVAFGWKSIQFRVRAYDAYGAVGPYIESNTITIINNRPPVISGEDKDLGTLTDSFPAQSYVVSDVDGDQVTVTVKLDEVVIESFTAELGKENILEIPVDEWRKLLNGPHTIKILVDDQPPLGLRQVSVPYGHLPLLSLFGTFNLGCKARWQRMRCRKNASSAPRARFRRGVPCVLRFVITPTTQPRHGKTSRRKF